MADDAKVRIGVEVVSDTAGAEKAAAEIKKIGEAAQDVARESQAAGDQIESGFKPAETGAKNVSAELQAIFAEMQKASGAKAPVDEVKNSLEWLISSVDGLGREKAVGAIRGLQNVLLGLGASDVQGQISGLSQGLFSLARALPLPGASIAVPAALAFLAGAFKVFGQSMKENAERPLNDLGETVEEEMSRIEEWAKKEIEWAGIKTANEKLRADFEQLKGVAESVMASISALYELKASGRAAELEKQAAAAEAAGDVAGAADLRGKAGQETQVAELVKLNVALTEAKAELARLVVQGQQAEQNEKDKAAAAAEYQRTLEELNAQILARFGNLDITGNAEAMATAVSELKDTIAQYEARQNVPGALPGAYDPRRAAEAAVLPGMKELLDSLRNYDAIAKRAKDAQQELQTAQQESATKQEQTAAGLQTAALNLAAAQERLSQATAGTDPALIGRAVDQAASLTESLNRFLDSVGTAALQTMAGTQQKVLESTQGIADATGTANQALKDGLARILEPVGNFGASVSESTAAAAEQMQAGAEAMGKATGDIAEKAVANGQKIKAGAEVFDKKVTDAAQSFMDGAGHLNRTAESIAQMAAEMSRNQAALAARLASVQAQTNAAIARADLALAQNRNRQE